MCYFELMGLSHMLCTLVDEPFDDRSWIFEVKWDGYRAFAKKRRDLQLVSRGKKSYNNRFPTLVNELKKLKGSFTIDGEIVILDKKGKSNFQMLQNYYKHKVGVPYFYVFDIVEHEGRDLKKLPLIQRKKILKKLLVHSPKHIRFSRHIQTKGKSFFKIASRKKLEGIIAKKADSSYQCKRSRDWQKIKTKNRQEVVIGGFTEPKGSRSEFGALHIGVYRKGELKYVGRVGGGFNRQLLKEVHRELKKYISKECPFSETPRGKATWIKPKLVCEVEFTEWTQDWKLRHPVFKGLRFDKSPKKVVRE